MKLILFQILALIVIGCRPYTIETPEQTTGHTQLPHPWVDQLRPLGYLSGNTTGERPMKRQRYIPQNMGIFSVEHD
jgi:hypothetical protein